jgi:hypothetical protein
MKSQSLKTKYGEVIFLNETARNVESCLATVILMSSYETLSHISCLLWLKAQKQANNFLGRVQSALYRYMSIVT